MILLNHQHLYYFWMVAKEGSVVKACQRLHLAQPTVSGQVIQLEKNLGRALFERHRKRLILTKDGRLVMNYAEKIFGQTREMLDALKNETTKTARIRIGVDEGVPKQAALKLLGHIQQRHADLRAVVIDGHLPGLLDRMRRYALDVVMSDQGGVVGENADNVRVETGRLEVLFAAVPQLARRIRHYPKGLTKVPLLIPPPSSPLWGSVQHFLTRHQVEPASVMEIEDAGLMRLAALKGLGAAPLSSIAVEEDLKQGALVRLGRAPTGITKTVWLTARKGYPQESLVGHLMEHFRL